MLEAVFFLILFIFIAIMLRASLIIIVPVLKPVEMPHLRIENMMKDADDMDYPISDKEYEEIKRAYGTTEGPSIVLAVLSLIGMCLLAVCVWDLLGMVHKVIYILITMITFIIWFSNFRKSKRVFKTDRALFRKKTAYLLDEDVKTFYGPRYSGGHFHGVRKVETYKVMVGVMDENGKPQAYVIQADPAVRATLKKQGTCDAILYKGKVSSFADLERCPNVSFENAAKNLVSTGFGLPEDKGEK